MTDALAPRPDPQSGLAEKLEAKSLVSLVTKLAQVMAAVERVPKRGRNEFHHYDYATEADIVATVRQELASRHVMLIPAVLGITREPIGEKSDVLTTLQMEFTFEDGDTQENLTRPWLGCGSDKGDKGIYKAMTGGEKYFLLKTFLMPTGDDPEADEKPKAQKPQYVVTAPAAAGPSPQSRGGATTRSDRAAADRGEPAAIPNAVQDAAAGSVAPDLTYLVEAPDANPQDAAAIEAGAVFLLEVRKQVKGKILGTAVTHQGEEVAIVKDSVLKVCEAVCQDGEPVYLDVRPGKNGKGLFLNDLKRARVQPGDRVDHGPIPDDAQTPF